MCLSCCTDDLVNNLAGVSDTTADQQGPSQQKVCRCFVARSPCFFKYFRRAPGRQSRLRSLACIKEGFGKVQVNVCYFGLVTNLFKYAPCFRFFLKRLSKFPLEPVYSGLTGQGFGLPASIANPSADFERALEHLHCFSMLAQGQKHIAETIFRQSLAILIANLMINCQGRLIPAASSLEIAKVNKNIPDVVILGGKASTVSGLAIKP